MRQFRQNFAQPRITLVRDSTLEYEWELFKSIQVNETTIPNRYMELMAPAVSVAAKCRYCTLFHGACGEEVPAGVSMKKKPVEPVSSPCPDVSEEDVASMSQKELIQCAQRIGAHPGESLEDSAYRFEQEGDQKKAELLHYMAFRWWAMEE